MFAKDTDIHRLERELRDMERRIDGRLSVIQWIGLIILAFNAMTLSAFLWAVAAKVL